MPRFALAGATAVVLFCSLLLSMDAKARPLQDGRVHPTPESIPADDDVDLLLTRSLELTPSMQAALAPMDTDPILVVGDDEVDEEFLTTVAGAAIHDGSLFVLDEGQKTVRVFALDGSRAYSIGSAGQGPAEFMRPTGMTVADDGNLIVVDASRRVQLLDRNDGHQIRQFSPNYTAENICIVDGHLFVRGYRDAANDTAGSTLLETDWEANVLATIAPGYDTENPTARHAMSRGGFLACDRTAGTLTVAYEFRPVIEAFGLSRGRRWVAKVGDFVPFPVRESTMDGRPAVTYSIPEKVGHIIRSFNTIAPGVGAIGIGEAGPEASTSWGRLVWLFSMDGERGGYVGNLTEWPIYGDDGYLVTLSIDPAPVVRVYER